MSEELQTNTNPKGKQKPMSNTQQNQPLNDALYAKERINDPAWIAFSEAITKLRHAANNLQEAWIDVEDDGNHPAILCGSYPFEQSFADLEIELMQWDDDTRELTERIRNGTPPPETTPSERNYLIHVFGCVEPDIVAGPMADGLEFDAKAKEIHAGMSDEDALFGLVVKADGQPEVYAFSGAFFEDDEDDNDQ